MDIVQEICSVPKADAKRKIAIIPVSHKLAEASIMLDDHPLWLWSAHYAQEEGWQPIVLTHDDVIRHDCMHAGVTASIAESNDRVLINYPCDYVCLLDPTYPLRPKGLLRHIGIMMTQEETLPAIKAKTGGIICYDTYVYRRVPELDIYGMRTVHTPDVCDTRVMTQEEADMLEIKIQNRKYNILNPWFKPEYIGVALPNVTAVSDKIVQTIKECDLVVKITGCSNEIKMDVNEDLRFLQTIRDENTEFPISYSLYQDTNIGRNVAEMSCILAKSSAASKLKDFTAILAWFHLTYPDAKILYYGNPNLQSTKVNFSGNYALNRSFSTVLEKNIWDNITALPTFQFAGDKLIRSEHNSSETPAFDDDYFFDPANIREMTIIHAMNVSWSSRLVLNKQFNRGGRTDAKDAFNIIEFVEGSYLHLYWDKWGEEYYIRKQGTNIWEACKKEDVEFLRNSRIPA